MDGEETFCFFQTAETRNRAPDSSVKGSGANHYPRAPAHIIDQMQHFYLSVGGNHFEFEGQRQVILSEKHMTLVSQLQIMQKQEIVRLFVTEK